MWSGVTSVRADTTVSQAFCRANTLQPSSYFPFALLNHKTGVEMSKVLSLAVALTLFWAPSEALNLSMVNFHVTTIPLETDGTA